MKHNWDQIQTAYISDPTQTYESLSEKYAVSPKAICQHAQRGRWKDKRREFEHDLQIKLQKKLSDKKAKHAADEIAKMNKAHYDSQQGLKYLADKTIVENVKKAETGQKSELSVKQLQTLYFKRSQIVIFTGKHPNLMQELGVRG